MKLSSCLVFLIGFVCVSATGKCHRLDMMKCYEAQVNHLLNKQIGVELKGHYTYLHLSYIFTQSNHYYPKVSKYFRQKADEEMKHAERFMEYQNQRGGSFEITSVTRETGDKCRSIDSLEKGFACAKQVEIDVTRALTKLHSDVSDVRINQENCVARSGHIEANKELLMGQSILATTGTTTKHIMQHPCGTTFDKVEYIELAELIAHEFLGHQIEDTKELANIVATLGGFTEEDPKLGSFLFDKHLDL